MVLEQYVICSYCRRAILWSGLFKNCVPPILSRCVSFKWRKLSDSWLRIADLPVHQAVEGECRLLSAGIDLMVTAGDSDGLTGVDSSPTDSDMKSLKLSIMTPVRKSHIQAALRSEQVGDVSLQLISWVLCARHEELKWFMQGFGLTEWSEWFSSRLAYCCLHYLEITKLLVSNFHGRCHHWDDSEGLYLFNDLALVLGQPV